MFLESDLSMRIRQGISKTRGHIYSCGCTNRSQKSVDIEIPNVKAEEEYISHIFGEDKRYDTECGNKVTFLEQSFVKHILILERPRCKY